MLLSSGFSHDRSVLFLEHLFHYQNHYCFHSPQPFKFRRQVLIIRPVYLFLLLHIHFGIPWHGYIYQERCLFVVVDDCMSGLLSLLTWSVCTFITQKIITLYVFVTCSAPCWNGFDYYCFAVGSKDPKAKNS